MLSVLVASVCALQHDWTTSLQQSRPSHARRRARVAAPVCKGVAGFRFNLDMWYGGDDFAGDIAREFGAHRGSNSGRRDVYGAADYMKPDTGF